MAIEVRFYTFNKNPNSTKRPSTEAGVTFACVLIESTSIVNPQIALVGNSNPTAYNYAFIPDFNRYYFVNDWVYYAGRWTAGLNVDVLASFKDSIGASRQYVLRSAAEYNGKVIDTLYPAENIPNTLSVTDARLDVLGSPFTAELSKGIYVVGIINNDGAAVGAVAYYKFTNTQFRNFCNALMSNPEWAFTGVEEMSVELFKAQFNPFQYVVSCQWFPFTDAFPGVAVTTIPYGWWSMPTPATRITTFTRLVDAVFNIPKHPQSAARGEYLNGAPYSRYTLVWPGIGTFPLDANLVAGEERLLMQCYVDAVSGKCCAVILGGGGGNNAHFVTTESQIGVSIQLAQVASDYLGAATSLGGAVGSFLTGGIGGGISAIGNAIESAMPKVQTSGGNGMTTPYYFNATLECEFYRIANETKEHRGRPLCSERVIKNLTGYILTSNAELEAPCTAVELDRIKSFMNGGFFYE